MNNNNPDQGKVLVQWIKSSERLPDFSNKELVYREKDGNMFVIFINVKEDLKADDYFYEWLEETTLPSQPVKEEDSKVKEYLPIHNCTCKSKSEYDNCSKQCGVEFYKEWFRKFEEAKSHPLKEDKESVLTDIETELEDLDRIAYQLSQKEMPASSRQIFGLIQSIKGKISKYPSVGNILSGRYVEGGMITLEAVKLMQNQSEVYARQNHWMTVDKSAYRDGMHEVLINPEKYFPSSVKEDALPVSTEEEKITVEDFAKEYWDDTLSKVLMVSDLKNNNIDKQVFANSFVRFVAKYRKDPTYWNSYNGFGDAIASTSTLSTPTVLTEEKARHYAELGWDAADEFGNHCTCGDCAYCLMKFDSPPDKQTFLSSLSVCE